MPQTRRARGTRMADDVHRELKKQAVDRDMTMEDLLDQILREALGMETDADHGEER